MSNFAEYNKIIKNQQQQVNLLKDGGKIVTRLPAIFALALWAGVLWLIAPEKSTEKQRTPFWKLNIAHRGLHTKDKTIPENSLPAFVRAEKAGYGIELDVQLSKDGTVMVFHDDTLWRVCGRKGRLRSFCSQQLNKMYLFGTKHTIPSLQQVLEQLEGKAPLVVELKSGKNNTMLCQKTLELMRTYPGPWCVESFDPRILAWFRHNAPDVLRGQLADSPDSFRQWGPAAGALLGNLLGNCIARPHFVAWGHGKKTLAVKLCEKMGAMKLRWTVRPEDCREPLEGEYDGIIFEYETPKVRYQ